MRSIELFAGAGGLGMGVALAGFRSAEIVERDQACCDTLRENARREVAPVAGWTVTQGDVRAIDFSRHEGSVQLVAGGPPCQPFSIGGKHRAHKDSRDMFSEAVRALREVRPAAFIFENVKGLTRASFQNYFEYIRLQMTHPEIVLRDDEDWLSHHGRLERHETRGRSKGLRYNLICHLANAADYGVPQKRERVFFVGFRSDLDVAWKFPDATHSADSLAWEQYRSGDYWSRHSVGWKERTVSEPARARAWKLGEAPSLAPWRTVRDALVGLPDPERQKGAAAKFRNHRQQAGARAYTGHTGSPLDAPAKTLKAGVHGVPGGENMLARPDGSVRYFSVRESARLQTFPDDFGFEGPWSEAMRQLGNAVPVTLARVVAQDVKAHLERKLGVQAV